MIQRNPQSKFLLRICSTANNGNNLPPKQKYSYNPKPKKISYKKIRFLLSYLFHFMSPHVLLTPTNNIRINVKKETYCKCMLLSANQTPSFLSKKKSDKKIFLFIKKEIYWNLIIYFCSILLHISFLLFSLYQQKFNKQDRVETKKMKEFSLNRLFAVFLWWNWEENHTAAKIDKMKLY